MLWVVFIVGSKRWEIVRLGHLQNTFGKNASAAGVFTVNKFKAAPVQVSKKILKRKTGFGINSFVINSGNANAVTGAQV